MNASTSTSVQNYEAKLYLINIINYKTFRKSKCTYLSISIIHSTGLSNMFSITTIP